MSLALKEAVKARNKDEVPIGCIIVKDDKVLARAHNLKIHKKDSTCHAEVECIRKACKKLNSYYLNDCEMYVTLEPCMMCMGAIKQARISRVVYGVDNYAFGYLRKLEDGKLVVKKGILKEECLELLSNFFKSKRKGE